MEQQLTKIQMDERFTSWRFHCLGFDWIGLRA